MNLESKMFSSFLKKSKLCDGCLRRALGTHKCSRCRDARFCSQVELDRNIREVFEIMEKALSTWRKLYSRGPLCA